MNEIEELKEKLIGMDKAYFDSIKKCESTKRKLRYLCALEFIVIFLLGLLAINL